MDEAVSRRRLLEAIERDAYADFWDAAPPATRQAFGLAAPAGRRRRAAPGERPRRQHDLQPAARLRRQPAGERCGHRRKHRGVRSRSGGGLGDPGGARRGGSRGARGGARPGAASARLGEVRARGRAAADRRFDRRGAPGGGRRCRGVRRHRRRGLRPARRPRCPGPRRWSAGRAGGASSAGTARRRSAPGRSTSATGSAGSASAARWRATAAAAAQQARCFAARIAAGLAEGCRGFVTETGVPLQASRRPPTATSCAPASARSTPGQPAPSATAACAAAFRLKPPADCGHLPASAAPRSRCPRMPPPRRPGSPASSSRRSRMRATSACSCSRSATAGR